MIEAIAVVFMLVSVWLAARQNVLTWPTGIVSVSCFAFVFWDKALYAAAILQGIYLVQSAWGWWQWSQPQSPVGRLEWHDHLLMGFCVCTASFCGGLLLTLTPSPSPMLDAWTFCLSILATGLLTYRYIETWWVWMAVNAIYCVLFASQGLFLTAALSLVLIGVNVYALRSWKRSA